VKEKPILMSPESVLGILQQRKTQTRRVINPQPKGEFLGDAALARWAGSLAKYAHPTPTHEEVLEKASKLQGRVFPFENGQGHLFSPNVQYAVGDHLWVKEPWALSGARLIDPCLNYKADGCQRPVNKHKGNHDLWYPYGSNNPISSVELMAPDLGKLGWRNAMFMPRWASRILLEVKKVRVERVQAISEADCIAEGCPNQYLLGVNWYRPLWDKINGKREGGIYAWAKNPWCWCLTFERIS